MKTLKIACAAVALYVLAGNPPGMAQSGRTTDHWVGTWGTAMVARPQGAPPGLPGQPAPAGQPGQGPQSSQGSQSRGQAPQPPPLNFSNQTLRQIVHPSIGGAPLRGLH